MKIEYSYSKASDLPAIKELLSQESSDDRDYVSDKFLLAKNDKYLVGCIRIKALPDNILELASLVVAENDRRLGIGKTLVDKILTDELRRPIYLITNTDLSDFYENTGFRSIEYFELPKQLLIDYQRIIKLPFAKKMKVIAMVTP